MSHTKGPWRTGSLISYNGSTGEPEAFVYRLPPDHPEETAHNRICVRGSHSAMDCDADARLIAAAPELLEALKQVGNAYGCFAGCTASLAKSNECADHTYNCKKARSAIAKAEGR